ncbi:conserved hypothetical protein [Burkholderia sp. 8Y]|nr:conserved hypothetical protein [Burkholderia sp. 8Y]
MVRAGRTTPAGSPNKKGSVASPLTGAGDESRTRDLNLGKVALYQLSYSRIKSCAALLLAIYCLLFPVPLRSRAACTEDFKTWSGRRVSNSRPQPWQGCALPTELLPHELLP